MAGLASGLQPVGAAAASNQRPEYKCSQVHTAFIYLSDPKSRGYGSTHTLGCNVRTQVGQANPCQPPPPLLHRPPARPPTQPASEPKTCSRVAHRVIMARDSQKARPMTTPHTARGTLQRYTAAPCSGWQTQPKVRARAAPWSHTTHACGCSTHTAVLCFAASHRHTETVHGSTCGGGSTAL